MSRRQRIIMAVTGVCWLVLGYTSNTAPVFSYDTYLLASTAAGGAAFAVARHATLTAARAYLTIVCGYAAVRSLAFISIGAKTAPAVWVLVVCSTLLVADMFDKETETR